MVTAQYGDLSGQKKYEEILMNLTEYETEVVWAKKLRKVLCERKCIKI